MKLVLFLLCGFVFTLSAKVRAQDQLVTLKVEKVTFPEIISKLKYQTNLDFFYSLDEIDVKREISLDVKEMSIDNVLYQILGNRFTWECYDNMVVIKPSSRLEEKKSLTVTGVVYDDKKHPMAGVTVQIVGTSLGTLTTDKGWFSITLPILKGKLQFSFVGYKKQEIDFSEKNNVLKVYMQEEASDLDEVVVVAYGERKKRELISAVSSVKADEMKELPTDNFINMLQGRMAGVEITSQSGSPGGGGAVVAIRGYNSLMVNGASDGTPLYVVDGVPMYSFVSPVTGANALADLDPSMIESVEVLKDAAAAAIYGSRAGNGVILITTKKGRAGRAMFSANVSYSLSYLPEFPTQIGGRLERWYNIQALRNARVAKYDYATGTTNYPQSYEDAYGDFYAQYDKFWNAGMPYAPLPVLQDSLNPFYNNQSNWFKQLFRTGKVVNANIQASGGSENFRYMFGGGYYRESGIMIGSDFTRANILMNLSANPVERISIDGRAYLAYGDKSRNVRSHALAPAQKFEAMTSDPKATSTLLPLGGEVEKEVLKQLNGTVAKNDSYRLMLNTRLGIDILDGLSFTTSLGVDFTQANGNTFEPSYLSPLNENKSAGSITRNIGVSNENLLKFSRSIARRHAVEVLLGVTYNREQMHEINGYALRGASDKVYYVSNGSSDIYNYGSSEYPNYRAIQYYCSNYEDKKMLSYLGRIAYNFDSKYLMEFTFRRDGSSVFGEDVRWANFPSVAVGWIFSDEAFMRWAHFLDLGKIRVSWGTSGQVFSDPYLAHGLMTSGGSFLGKESMTSAGIINRNLTWEKSKQYDIGLDLDFWNYRFKFKLDYYYKYTKSLLYDVEIPGDFYGSGKQMQNAMEVSNEGIELEAMADIFRESAVSWRMRFNLSRNWNRFEKSYTGMDIDR